MLTEKQKIIRSKGIGASETAALLGLDPNRSPMDIYLKKLGLVDESATYHQERGNYLEPALREWASHKIGRKFEPCPTLTMYEHQRVMATPDGVCCSIPKQIVLELKSPGPRTYCEWHNDEVPERYLIQLVQQMLVADASEGYLAAFLGDDLKIYHFEREPELEAEIIGAIESFWHNHIETRIPPPVDGGKAARDYLSQQYPANIRPELIRADSRTEGLMIDLRELIAHQKKLEHERELTEQQLKVIVGDQTGVESQAIGKITWKSNKASVKTDWESLARSLNPTSQQITQHTFKKPGPRVFRATFNSEG